MKVFGKVIDFMDDHCIALYGTWVAGMLLWLVENKLKGND